MEPQKEYVLRTVEERGVRLIRLWFTDVLGKLKSVAISPAELEGAFEEGLQFDGSAIDGYSRVQESDVLAVPDANSFELLPWVDPSEPTGRIFCDIKNLDGSPFQGDPRQVLRRNLQAAHDKGFTFFTAPEIEFFYFNNASERKPLDNAGYFDLTTLDLGSGLRRRTLHMLEAMGIPIEYSFHEDAPSQYEIDLRYTDALTMADNVMTFRLIVREIALEHGVHATFMPKPLSGVQGSGMHTHLSLFKDGSNAFHDPESPDGLSAVAKGFIAGLLHHAREITAVTNQLVNSYKRLVTGYEAPVNVSWARANRAALIRVPAAREAGVDDTTRIEYRAPDPACNPYLTFAVILAAGMKGIEQGYELPLEAPPSMTGFTEHGGLIDQAQLPQSLDEALDEMEKSDLVADTLGDHLFSWFLRNKRREWNEYKAQVTPFELDRYYTSL